MRKLLRVLERPLKKGTTIESYEIVKLLGMGGFGITYLGKVKNSKNDVVIKQIRKYSLGSKKGIKSFQVEKDILSSISHPYIPRFIDERTWNGYQFLIMEYISGKTFEEEIFIYNKKFTEKQSFQYVLKLLDIVKYLHDRNIVHRDLRIPNIILKENDIYVIDFGLARYAKKENKQIKLSHQEKGLMRDITFQSDFFAIGHFVLFLLYSSFEPKTNKEKSWEEELQISSSAKRIIRRLLLFETPYENAEEIIQDVKKIV